MPSADRNLTFKGTLLRSPLFYLLSGAIPTVSLIFYFLTVDNYSLFLFVILALIFLVVPILIFSERTSRFALFLIGATGFGLYALLSFHSYLLTAGRLRGRRVLVDGMLSAEGELRLKKVNNKKAQGKVYVPSRQLEELPSPGRRARVSLTVTVNWPENDDFARFLRKRQYVGAIQNHELHSRTTRSEPVEGYIARFKKYFKQNYLEFEKRWPLSSTFSRALLLGERGALPGRVDRLLRSLGLSHLFVISGLHVGFLYFWLNKFIPEVTPLTRFVIVAVVLVSYLVFISWPISASRAVLMVLLLCLARLLKRRPSGVSFLLGAVFFLLIFDPFVVLRSSFQLTLGAMLGILATRPYASLLPNSDTFQLFVVSLGAFFGVAPVILYHYNYLPAGGVFLGFIAGMFFPVFIIMLGLQNVFLWTSWTFFADVVERLFNVIVAGLEKILILGDFVTGVGGVGVVGTLLLAGGLWLFLDVGWRVELRIFGGILVVVIMVAVFLPAHRPHLKLESTGGTAVTFLYPSDADPILIIPRRAKLNDYSVYRLNNQLADRGTRVLGTIISDYSRASLRKLGFGFPVRRVFTHWSKKGRVNLNSGGYDFTNNEIRSVYGKISYNNPLIDRPAASYNPEGVVGYNEKIIFVQDLGQLGTESFEKLRKSQKNKYFLKDGPYVLAAGGRNVKESHVIMTLNDRFYDLFLCLKSFWSQT